MATIFEDDFNSYDDGNLSGQGSWSGHANFQVQGITVREGAKAVVATANESISKTGASKIAVGSITVYIRKTSNSDGNAHLYLFEDTTFIVGWGLDESGKIISDASADTGLANYSADTWYCLEIEWHEAPSKQVRFRIDKDTWTEWENPANDWTDGLNVVKLQIHNISGNSVYYDYISEKPIFIEYSETITDALSLSSSKSTHTDFTPIITDVINMATSVKFGIETVITSTMSLVSSVSSSVIVRLWAHILKSVSSWTHKSKNTSSYTKKSKNTSTWTNKSKS